MLNDIFSLEGKTVVLTGGCGNLGRVMAKYLADYGARLFIADILDEMVGGLSGDIHYIKCDLSDTGSVREMFENVQSICGPLDSLVNNAAYGGGTGNLSLNVTRLEDFDDAMWARGLDGTAGVTFRCIREAIPYLKPGASIVNIASMYGMVAPDFSIYGDTGAYSPVMYGAGKAGVIQLTKYCASCLAGKGIRVNSITPGPFPKIGPESDMDFIAKLQKKTMLGRTGEADDLAGPLIMLISDASGFMTGANIVVDGVWTAW